MSRIEDFEIPEGATGFSIYKFANDVCYDPIDLSRGRQGCDVIYRRLLVASGIAQDGDTADGICDIHDAQGDRLDSFYLTASGLSYCYKKLNLRVSK